MELNEYQKKAMATRMDSCANYAYMSEGLDGEVGEFKGKIAKLIRKGIVAVHDNKLFIFSDGEGREELLAGLKAELGDILWFVAGLADEMCWTLEDVAQANIDKLASRQVRGVIDGEGDNR